MGSHFPLILSVCMLLQLGATNGIIFMRIHKSGPYSDLQPVTSNQANRNEENRSFSFLPPFFSIFRPQFPFWHISDEGKQAKDNKTDSSVQHEESKVNELAKQGMEEKLNAVTPEHHVSKKLIYDKDNEEPILERYDNRPRPYPLPLWNYWGRKEKAKQEDDIQTTPSTMEKLNESGVTDDQLMLSNCTGGRLIRRYFFAWKINWSSLFTHLMVILLISGFVTIGLLHLCQSYSSTERHEARTRKLKSLNI